MRLTLRTLLAYRDGVLGAEDAEEMHRRIHQSEDASNLLRRVERVTSSVGRTSTTLVGKGLGGDPNSIAEYLDDVLPKDKVPELERICLENDEYLDELASCHAWLSSAMHTRVTIPSELRELAKSIGDPAKAAELREELKDRRKKSSTPKMIRRVDSPSAVAGPHGAVGQHQASSGSDSAGVDPKQNGTASEIEETKEGVEVVAPMLRSGGESIQEQGLSLEGASLTHEVPEYLLGNRGGGWRIPLGILGLMLLLVGALYFAIGPLDRVQELFADSSEPADVDPADTVAETLGPKQSEQPGADAEEPPVDDISNSDAGTNKDAVVPSAEMPSNAGVPLENPTGDIEPVSESDGSSAGTASPPPVDPDVGNGTGSDAASEPMKQETTWSPSDGWGDSLLLARSGKGKLQRLMPGDPLEGDSELFVPPSSLIQLTTPQQNEIKVLGPSIGLYASESEPMKLEFGRMLATAGPSQKLELETPQGKIRIEYSGPKSTAAIQFEHRFKSYGAVSDPEAFQPALIIVCDAPTKIVAVEREGMKFELAAGEGLALVSSEKPKKFRLQQIPAWYQLPRSRPIDQVAAAELSVDLVPDQAGELESVLGRLTTHWRPEEAALAVSISMMAGQWDPFARSGFLENPRASIHVQPMIHLARQLLAIRPNGSDQLRRSLRNQFDNGAELFRLVLGSEQTALEGDGLAKLIDSLDADSLAERHLGFAELNRVTGRKIGYKPSQQNRASLLAWRREAAMSKLEIVRLPDIIRERMSPQ